MVSITRTPAVVRANGDNARQMVPYGWFSFRRTGALVPFKGMLAHDFLTLVSLDPDVSDISKRVRYLQWYDGARWRQHAPRYAIHRRRRASQQTSVLYVDVLWSWEQEENKTKYGRLQQEAIESNLDYRVFTEQDVRVNPRLLNAKIVQKFASSNSVRADVAEAVRRFADDREDFSVNDAVSAGVASYADAYAGALHLVAIGRLTFPFGRRFDADTRIAKRVT